jgi:hypothetical protein
MDLEQAIKDALAVYKKNDLYQALKKIVSEYKMEYRSNKEEDEDQDEDQDDDQANNDKEDEEDQDKEQSPNKTNVIIESATLDKIYKKRGRKPKGGKIVEVKNILVNSIPHQNVILHLNCHIKNIMDNVDINYNPIINEINNYNIYNNKKLA